MEQLNRIELRGNVGTVRLGSVEDTKVANFTLATSYAYVGRGGEGIIDTMWHNVVAWEGRSIPDVSCITKGAPLYVCGRLRERKFIGSDGQERIALEVLASKVVPVDDPEGLSIHM